MTNMLACASCGSDETEAEAVVQFDAPLAAKTVVQGPLRLIATAISAAASDGTLIRLPPLLSWISVAPMLAGCCHR
ncbi:hypothetical protein FQZ97_508280 [compost metagenome]